MKFNTALFLATAGSLVAAQGAHRHGHRHLHRRDAATAVATDVVYVYQLDGKEVSANEVCEGVKSGKYLWADGSAPAGACSTASATPTPSSSAVEGPAEFFETPSSSPTPTPSSTSSSSSSSSTFTSSSTISVSSSTTTSSTSTSSAWTSSSVASSSPSPSSTPSTLNGGGVSIVNEVGQTVYLWSTSENAGQMITLPAGQTYSETWKLNPDQGGISIKIATTPEEDDVMQFEYTLLTPIIWWDVSLINMEISSLFDKLGFSVTSDSSQCYTVNCPAGETACHDAYLWPTDDQATHSCNSDTQMTLHLGKPLLSSL